MEKPQKKFAAGDANLKEAYERYNTQLGEWKIDQDKELWRLGKELEFDASKEHFVGGKTYKQANKRLKRVYRPAFEVPVNV